jgi:hypothetical protein
MGEITDVLFGLLACAQVANRDGAVRLAAEVDVPQDQLDRHPRPVGMAQLAFDRLIRAFQ